MNTLTGSTGTPAAGSSPTPVADDQPLQCCDMVHCWLCCSQRTSSFESDYLHSIQPLIGNCTRLAEPGFHPRRTQPCHPQYIGKAYQRIKNRAGDGCEGVFGGVAKIWVREAFSLQNAGHLTEQCMQVPYYSSRGRQYLGVDSTVCVHPRNRTIISHRRSICIPMTEAETDMKPIGYEYTEGLAEDCPMEFPCTI